MRKSEDEERVGGKAVREVYEEKEQEWEVRKVEEEMTRKRKSFSELRSSAYCTLIMMRTKLPLSVLE